MKLTDGIEIETITLLTTRYKLSTRFINILIDDLGLKDCEQLLNKELNNKQKLKLLLCSEGSLLFTGSSDIKKELRKRIIEKWPETVLNERFEKDFGNQQRSKSHKVRKLYEKRW